MNFDFLINIFNANTPIVVALGILLVLIYKAHKSKRLDWCDMITRDGSKVSTTKVLQLIGGAVATWVIIKLTYLDKLTWDLFAIYLAYVASIDGFSKLILAKYTGKSEPEQSDKT